MADQVNIVHGYPPNFEIIKAAMPHANETHVYCYGDTIFCPDGHEPKPDIIFHESIHTKQQGGNPSAWWARYLSDPNFRLDQELQAYGEQYLWLLTHVKASNSFFKWALQSMATALSGDAYGNLLSYGQAETRIKAYAKR